MRSGLLLVLLAGLASACAAPPVYKDPLETAGGARSAYSDIRLGLVLSDGFKMTAGTVASTHSFYAAWGQSGGTMSLDTMAKRINDGLSKRFAEVVRYESIDEARNGRPDWIMQLGAQVSVGQFSFQQTSMTMSANVTDGDGRVIDAIAGTGNHTVPYPNTSNMMEHAFADALHQFLANIDGSPKLATAVAPAIGRRGQALASAAAPQSVVPVTRRSFSFPAGPRQDPDAVAVVIGNQAYRHADVPPVQFALNDAAAVQQYLVTSLGFAPRNVILLENARQSDLLAYFGSRTNEKGRLFDMIRPGRSDVFVFYSGHGVPGEGGAGYLLPIDADPGKPQLTGYAIETLVANLGKVNARSVVLAIDSCFSGASESGALVKDASPIYLSSRLPAGLANGIMLTAADGRQIASWDRDASLGLFTRYLLEGLLGKADDRSRGGDGDGQVSAGELKAWLASEVTYEARRRYGRDQTPQISGDTRRVLAAVPAGKFGGF